MVQARGPGAQVDLDSPGPSTALSRVDFAAYVSKDASLERMAAWNQAMAAEPPGLDGLLGGNSGKFPWKLDDLGVTPKL